MCFCPFWNSWTVYIYIYNQNQPNAAYKLKIDEERGKENARDRDRASEKQWLLHQEQDEEHFQDWTRISRRKRRTDSDVRLTSFRSRWCRSWESSSKDRSGIGRCCCCLHWCYRVLCHVSSVCATVWLRGCSARRMPSWRAKSQLRNRWRRMC